jgi:hypothetical protein
VKNCQQDEKQLKNSSFIFSHFELRIIAEVDPEISKGGGERTPPEMAKKKNHVFWVSNLELY